MQPVYTSIARRDLTDIAEYIASRDRRAAAKWLDRLEERCLLLARSPTFGDPMPHLGNGVRATA